jgi:hypothetical protein
VSAFDTSTQPTFLDTVTTFGAYEVVDPIFGTHYASQFELQSGDVATTGDPNQLADIQAQEDKSQAEKAADIKAQAQKLVSSIPWWVWALVATGVVVVVLHEANPFLMLIGKAK